MSMAELEVIAGFFQRSVCPEDIFGNAGPTKQVNEDSLKHNFRKLAKALHPDSHASDTKAQILAEKLFKELELMRSEAEKAINVGTYGKRDRFSWKIPLLIKGKYVVDSQLCAGNIADLHTASIESSGNSGSLILKIARSESDNDLLNAEQAIIKKIREKMKAKGAQDWPQTIPNITDSFILDDGRGKRRVNVMERFTGFYDAAEIKRRIPEGIDGRTAVWMWKRLLVLMEWITKSGYLHGAILPPHIMFYPDNDGHTVRDVRKHSIRLIDWCYAIEMKSRTRLSAWVSPYKDFYAPEVISKMPLGPWTDLYMGAKTMFFLCHGEKPDYKRVPKFIFQSLQKCMKRDPMDRPQSIGKYFLEFTELAKEEYGARKYHDFILPGI